MDYCGSVWSGDNLNPIRNANRRLLAQIWRFYHHQNHAQYLKSEHRQMHSSSSSASVWISHGMNSPIIFFILGYFYNSNVNNGMSKSNDTTWWDKGNLKLTQRILGRSHGVGRTVAPEFFGISKSSKHPICQLSSVHSNGIVLLPYPPNKLSLPPSSP